jgi:hypothetical protein
MTEGGQDGGKGIVRRSDVQSPTSVDAERVSANARLVAAMYRTLRGEGILAARRESEAMPKTTHFVTVVAEDGTRIHLTEDIHDSAGSDETGDHAVTAVFLDSKNKQLGRIMAWTMQGNDQWQTEANRESLSDQKLAKQLEYWDRNGGASDAGNPTINMSNPKMTEEEIGRLADQLETAVPNADMTERAMQFYVEKLKLTRVENPNSEFQQGILPPGEDADGE